MRSVPVTIYPVISPRRTFFSSVSLFKLKYAAARSAVHQSFSDSTVLSLYEWNCLSWVSLCEAKALFAGHIKRSEDQNGSWCGASHVRLAATVPVCTAGTDTNIVSSLWISVKQPRSRLSVIWINRGMMLMGDTIEIEACLVLKMKDGGRRMVLAPAH